MKTGWLIIGGLAAIVVLGVILLGGGSEQETTTTTTTGTSSETNGLLGAIGDIWGGLFSGAGAAAGGGE